jgi:tRNA wybutosine-synthesizing protein 3
MPSKAPRQLPPIPPAFAAKKAAILASLAVPASEYQDLSPKGSVDEGIIPLIKKINTLDGVITTSSCAGRVSVFLEGRKTRKSKGKLHEGEDVDRDGGRDPRSEQVVVTGGKGNGGRWLFVSHEPVDVERLPEAGKSVTDILGIAGDGQQNGSIAGNSLTRPGMRLVRFQFEPMVCTTVPHVLSTIFHISTISFSAFKC